VNKKEIVKLLSKAVGSRNVLSSPPDLVAYSYDATGKQALPDIVVIAENTAQVSEVMQIASRYKIPVVVRGAGTNLSGGTVPHNGGIVLELSRMNRILEVDPARQRAVVEPGVVNLDLQNALLPLGYMYAPDPASQKNSTVGGNLGEDAGGPHCLKYGVTSNHIMALEWVLPDGRIVQLGSPVDDSYGYDLLGPVVGSEGTMGIATKITVRIMRLPEAYQTLMAIFNTLEDAGQAVSDIIAAGIVPAALELLDNTVVKAIEDSFHVGYPLDAEALLLIEVDGVKEGLSREAERIMEICRASKAREVKLARTAAERDGLWRGRRGAFGAIARLKSAYSVQDATVPRNKMVPMLREVSKIGQKYRVLIGNVAHAGDGNLHPLLIYDVRDQDETHRVEKAGKEILAACVKLDGSISGEHGIGVEKLSSMPLMFTQPEMDLMSRVKRVFDPLNLLNPGKVIPVGAVKVAEIETSQVKPSAGKSFYSDVIAIVGGNNVPAEQQGLTSYVIDGKKPLMVVFPANHEQVCGVVKIAERERIPVIPYGNGSKQSLGMPLKNSGIVLSLKHLNNIIEVDAPNLTVEVEAGMSHAKLQMELAKQGLYFPLEPEDSAQATIGGSLATNSSGPGRLLYGTARDLVLRITMVTPQGEIVRAGSKTMKNVAGFDLRKLMLGSWGTLGIITSAVLRLVYLPEDHRTVMVKLASIADVSRVTSSILSSFLRPESMELIDSGATRFLSPGSNFRLNEGELALLIGASGNREVVERHAAEVRAIALASGAQSVVVLDGDDEREAWEAQRGVRLYQSPELVKGKAVVPYNKLAEMYQEIKEIAAQHKWQVGVSGRAGNGILYPAFFCGDGQPDKLETVIAELSQRAARIGGFFLMESGPVAIREKADIIRGRSDYELMRRLKQAFDPLELFNPGKVIRDL